MTLRLPPERPLFVRDSATGILYLIATNPTSSSVSTTLTVAGLPLSSATRLYEGGDVNRSGNTLSDTFERYQVHVYELR